MKPFSLTYTSISRPRPVAARRDTLGARLGAAPHAVDRGASGDSCSAPSRRSPRSSSPALAVHVQQRRQRTEGIARWAVRLGVRRAQSGVSVVPGTAAAGGAVLGRSVQLSDMAERTCTEPPGTHPREGAARGGAARPVNLELVRVVGRPAGAQLRRHGHRGAADTPRRVMGPGNARTPF